MGPAAEADGSTRSMDEQANGTGQAVERNPDGSPGGSKANPSPRAVPLTMGERRRPFPGGAFAKKTLKPCERWQKQSGAPARLCSPPAPREDELASGRRAARLGWIGETRMEPPCPPSGVTNPSDSRRPRHHGASAPARDARGAGAGCGRAPRRRSRPFPSRVREETTGGTCWRPQAAMTKSSPRFTAKCEARI
jgi:hypothetical protein